MRKSITEIAKEAIQENPGWAIKAENLYKIAEKYQVNSSDIFKEMVRLSN